MLGLLKITSVPLSSAEATALITRLEAELAERYPDLTYSRFELTPSQVRAGHGVFLIARAGSEPVGCGALRRLDHTTGEIKRMYVLPSVRGTRIACRLLAELERHARQNGLRRLILATGVRQPEAIRLYERSGFARIPSPPNCAYSHVRVFMAKALTR